MSGSCTLSVNNCGTKQISRSTPRGTTACNQNCTYRFKCYLFYQHGCMCLKCVCYKKAQHAKQKYKVKSILRRREKKHPTHQYDVSIYSCCIQLSCRAFGRPIMNKLFCSLKSGVFLNRWLLRVIPPNSKVLLTK